MPISLYQILIKRYFVITPPLTHKQKRSERDLEHFDCTIPRDEDHGGGLRVLKIESAHARSGCHACASNRRVPARAGAGTGLSGGFCNREDVNPQGTFPVTGQLRRSASTGLNITGPGDMSTHRRS